MPHDAGKPNFISFLSQRLLPKICFVKTAIFIFCHLDAKSSILGEICELNTERALKGLSNALFRGAVALLVPELCRMCQFVEKC